MKWHQIRNLFGDLLPEEYESNDIIEIIELKNHRNLKVSSKNKSNSHGNKTIICVEKCYLKDNSSQTERLDVLDRSSQTCTDPECKARCNRGLKKTNSTPDTVSLVTRSIQTTTEDSNQSPETKSTNVTNILDVTFPLANSTAVSSNATKNALNTSKDELIFFTPPDFTSKYFSIGNNEFAENDPTAHNSTSQDLQVRGKEVNDTTFSFLSALDEGPDWNNITDEVTNTVKKLDEYIYDDYDTFTKEDFNQIFDQSKY